MGHNPNQPREPAGQSNGGQFASVKSSDKAKDIERAVEEHKDKSAAELKREILADGIDLSDEIIPRSIGAKWANYDIRMPDGGIAHLAEGTHISNKKVIAGGNSKRQIDEIDNLVEKYRGDAKRWTKIKAEAVIVYNAKEEKAEIHWYEEPTVGRVKMKYKRPL